MTLALVHHDPVDPLGCADDPARRGASITIPGYMVFAALIYAVGGTLITRWIGYPLIRLNFDQQRYEADFRFSMVRLRENAENVAFYGGEAREFDTFQTRFARIVANWWGIIRRRKKLTWFTTGYSQLAIIFPFVVAAPALFRQGNPARRVDADLLRFQPGAGFAVVYHQLLYRDRRIPVGRRSGFPGFARGWTRSRLPAQAPAADRDRAQRRGCRVASSISTCRTVRCCGRTSRSRRDPGKLVLITGASGLRQEHVAARHCRALAVRPRPHPGWRRSLPCSCRSGPTCRSALWPTLSPIPELPPRLPARQPGRGAACGRIARTRRSARRRGNWAQRLSIGEQQRLAFARVLLTRPEIVFLDEATSALDEVAEACPYTGCCAKPPGGRRSSASATTAHLRRFHDIVVDLARSPISRAVAG